MKGIAGSLKEDVGRVMRVGVGVEGELGNARLCAQKERKERKKDIETEGRKERTKVRKLQEFQVKARTLIPLTRYTGTPHRGLLSVGRHEVT